MLLAIPLSHPSGVLLWARVFTTSPAEATCSLLFGAFGAGSSRAGNGAQGSGGFDRLNDALTSLGSLVELGFDAGDALLDCDLLVTDRLADLLLNFLIVDSCFFSRVCPVGSGAIEFLSNLGFLEVSLALLLLLNPLDPLTSLLVVGLGLLLDGAEHLGLALLSRNQLLRHC